MCLDYFMVVAAMAVMNSIIASEVATRAEMSSWHRKLRNQAGFDQELRLRAVQRPEG
jgi:hypothetical protein